MLESGSDSEIRVSSLAINIMSDPTKPRFRCSVCKAEYAIYASCLTHIGTNKLGCKDAGATVEVVHAQIPPNSNMTSQETKQWEEEQKKLLDIPQAHSNGKKSDSPPPEIGSGLVDQEEEIEKPGWPVKSMAQQAATQLLPDWIDEEGVEFPTLPEDYQLPEREVSAIQLIARGQAIVLDAIEIVAYEAWCREGWEGSLKQWVSECITGYLNFLGVEIIGFATPQPQREYLLAKAGLRDAT